MADDMTEKVSGNARVFGNARVSGNARVFDDARVFGGVINADARIGSLDDLCQIIHEGVVWSRFVTATGFRTTPDDDGSALVPEWVHRAFQAWEEARRG